MSKEKGLYKDTLTAGIIKENPIFVLLLGLCPTLGVTTSAGNGLGMGLATMAVLLCSNLIISLVKNFIPSKVRIPAYIMVIATLVTIVDLGMNAYLNDLHKSLGLFIPLIVVNCLVLGRAESFASKNNLFLSLLDGIGNGLGFTLALVLIGAIREILGSGAIFNYRFIPEGSDGILIFILAPGAFLTIGVIIAIQNKIKAYKEVNNGTR